MYGSGIIASCGEKNVRALQRINGSTTFGCESKLSIIYEIYSTLHCTYISLKFIQLRN